MKKISLFIIFSILILSLAGCTMNVVENQETSTTAKETPVEVVQEEIIETQEVIIAGLKGPTSMGMIQLFDELKPTVDNYAVEYSVFGVPDELVGKVINGEVQIAALPTNLASILYNKTQGKIQLLAVNTLGVIHVVGSGEITDLADLKGETLYLSGKGSTPDFAVTYMLEQLGLTDEVEIEFYPDHSSLAQAVIAKDIKYAVLPQPFVTQVTMQSPDVNLLVDLNEVWNDVSNGASDLAMGCLVINKEFADNNKDFIDAFMIDYENSVNWVNANPTEAGLLVEKHGILPSAKLAEVAIPYSAIVFQSAKDTQEKTQNFLNILYDFNPSSVGGELPDEDFYYGK